jgi:hypothetical protein
MLLRVAYSRPIERLADFGPARNAQAFQERGHMRLDGPERYPETFGNLLIVQPVDNERRDLSAASAGLA